MKKIFLLGMSTFAALAFGLMQVNAQKGATGIDVQHYKIDAELVPASQLLRARAEVRFVPLGETRSVIFEMNGSLAVKRITRLDSIAGMTTPSGQDPKAKTGDPKSKSVR